MPSLRTRLGLALSLASALGALALWQPPASAGQPPGAAAADDPMQVLADIVLIEAECRSLNVDYGRLFAYAERNGIRPVEIMPLGARRAAFDAATRRRTREALGDRLCGPLAREREEAVPGVFTAR